MSSPSSPPSASTVLVTITQDDITQGERASGRNCPVQRALKRALRNPKVYASFGICKETKGTVAFYRLSHSSQERFPLPSHLARFMAHFDEGMAVSPLSFSLQLP